MATYYQYVNWDRREVICLARYTNIKRRAYYSIPGLQALILNHLLSSVHQPITKYCGSWSSTRVSLALTDNEDTDGFVDIGELFIEEIMSKRGLGAFLHDDEWPAEMILPMYKTYSEKLNQERT